MSYSFPLKKRRRSGKRRRLLEFQLGQFVHPRQSDDFYYAIMEVGTPPQRVEMALDTGSGLPYFACKETCTHCGKHDDPYYVTSQSTTHKWQKCKEPHCGVCQGDFCHWSLSYLDGSSIRAKVSNDVVTFKKYDSNDTVQAQMVFGCSEQEANTIFHQTADGVMGLCMDEKSFIDQLFKQKNDEMGDIQFGHCFGAENGGIIAFGSREMDRIRAAVQSKYQSELKFKWTPMITGGGSNAHARTWYRGQVSGFRVQFNEEVAEAFREKQKAMAASLAMKNSNHTQTQTETTVSPRRLEMETRSVEYRSQLGSSYGGAVFDIGSSTLSMPANPANQIREGIIALAKIPLEFNPDPSKAYDYCLKDMPHLPSSTKMEEFPFDKFPQIVMSFDGDVEVIMNANEYMMNKKGLWCLDLFGDTPDVLIGSNALVNKFIVYDRKRQQIGVAPFECDLLTKPALVMKREIRTIVGSTDVEPMNFEFLFDSYHLFLGVFILGIILWLGRRRCKKTASGSGFTTPSSERELKSLLKGRRSVGRATRRSRRNYIPIPTGEEDDVDSV